MFKFLEKFIKRVEEKNNKDAELTDYIIRKIQAKGEINTQDFKGLIYSCPPLIHMLKDYLLNASIQEIGDMIKNGDLNASVVVELYSKLKKL